uniref:Uncharacterized protein n=2 Tax=Arsenophonus nasoniae TaxID=638 RepID=D2U1W8_9GAMM|nr:conserved hypothetical protein [Arsenophonus nasoniae]
MFMSEINMEEQYKKLIDWIKSLKPVSASLNEDYVNDSKLTVSTGDIIGAHQDKDLIIAQQLNEMTRDGKSTDITAEKLAESPANGLAIISTIAMGGIGYDPQKASMPGNSEAYITYAEEMKKNVLMMVEEDKLLDLNYREENYDDLIDKIVDIYDSITGADKQKIKNSVTQLAKAALSYSEQKNDSVLFTQGVIASANKDDVKFYINSSHILFERQTGKTKSEPTDKYVSRIQIKSIVLKMHTFIYDKKIAEILLDTTRSDLEEWIRKMKTKAKDNKEVMNYCFGNK